jgi:hypothetical protein
MANAKDRKIMESMISPEDLDDLQKFQGDLQARIDQAHDNGRSYMMAQYVVIMATVSIEIRRIQARFERDSLASSRKMLKVLKKEQKAARDAAKESGDSENQD